MSNHLLLYQTRNHYTACCVIALQSVCVAHILAICTMACVTCCSKQCRGYMPCKPSVIARMCYMSLACRCPNPSACIHDDVELARQHPYNTTTKESELLNWSQYGPRLCSAKEGYTGPFCGVCMEGYGATAPFICHRCFGAKFNSTGTVPVMTKMPTRVGISLMYVLYWFIGMLVTLYTVWSAYSAHYHATHNSQAQAQTADSTTAALADCDGVQADKTDPDVSITMLSGTDTVSCQGSISSSASSRPKNRAQKNVPASPMDIIKVRQSWLASHDALSIRLRNKICMVSATGMCILVQSYHRYCKPHGKCGATASSCLSR